MALSITPAAGNCLSMIKYSPDYRLAGGLTGATWVQLGCSLGDLGFRGGDPSGGVTWT